MTTVAVVVVAVAELLARVAMDRLSVDSQHIRSVPAIAREFSQGERPRVLFLGNSLTRNSVDLGTWKDQLHMKGLPLGSTAKVMPDDTSVLEWYYLFLNRFAAESLQPEVVVVSFAFDRHVADEAVDAARLGARFCGLDDIPEAFSLDLRMASQRGDFLLGHLLRCYGERERLQSRIGALVVPGYRTVLRDLNSRNRSDPGPSRAGGERRRSYTTLRRFVQLCRRSGTSVVFVVVPVPSVQSIDETIPVVLHQEGATFLDARQLPGVNSGSYPDGYHLNAEGAAAFTKWLASQAPEFLPGAERRGPSRRPEPEDGARGAGVRGEDSLEP